MRVGFADVDRLLLRIDDYFPALGVRGPKKAVDSNQRNRNKPKHKYGVDRQTAADLIGCLLMAMISI